MTRLTVLSLGAALVVSMSVALEGQAQSFDFRTLATSKTSTMEKEMNEAADAGFRYQSVMGGETAIGGKEVVVVVTRQMGQPAKARYQYKLLATSKTSTMQKELQQAADAGYEYRGQTVFDSMFGGQEVVCILERDRDNTNVDRYDYRLLATSKTSTMQKELQQVGEQGYELIGLTVGKTAMGGKELVAITRRKLK